MKNILVTTDLSVNSKVAIRFVMQLASQAPYELTFYYSDTSFIIDPYAAATFANIPEPDNKINEQRLKQFIQTLYRQTGKRPGKVNYIVESRLDVNTAIMECARRVNADYICMSTRGGGLINKLLGSHTSKMVTDSQVPVFVIPKHYRTKPLKTILYPSDIENIAIEISVVKKFALTLNASIAVYHYDYFIDEQQVKDKLDKIQRKFRDDTTTFHFKKLSYDISLLRHLQIDIIKNKPSIITMFTREDRSWFEQLFLSIKTAQKGFDAITPMLVFRKQ